MQRGRECCSAPELSRTSVARGAAKVRARRPFYALRRVNEKVEPLPLGRPHRDALVVGLNDVLYNRQAKSASTRIARTALVNPVKAFEDPGKVFF